MLFASWQFLFCLSGFKSREQERRHGPVKHVKGKIFEMRIVIGISGRYYGVYGVKGGGGAHFMILLPPAGAKEKQDLRLDFKDFPTHMLGQLEG